MSLLRRGCAEPVCDLPIGSARQRRSRGGGAVVRELNEDDEEQRPWRSPYQVHLQHGSETHLCGLKSLRCGGCLLPQYNLAHPN